MVNNILEYGSGGKVRVNVPGRRHSTSKGWEVRKHDVFGNDKLS